MQSPLWQRAAIISVLPHYISREKNIFKGIKLPFLQKSATWSFQSFHLKEDHAGIITVFILCKSKVKIWNGPAHLGIFGSRKS